MAFATLHRPFWIDPRQTWSRMRRRGRLMTRPSGRLPPGPATPWPRPRLSGQPRPRCGASSPRWWTPALADDLTQETYLRAFRALPAFEGRASARTWLFGIARRTCADHIRSTVRRRRSAHPGGRTRIARASSRGSVRFGWRDRAASPAQHRAAGGVRADPGARAVVRRGGTEPGRADRHHPIAGRPGAGGTGRGGRQRLGGLTHGEFPATRRNPTRAGDRLTSVRRIPESVRLWLGTAARLVLGVVWIVAGATKVTDLAASGRSVAAYRILPYEGARFLGAVLPFLEIALGILLDPRAGHPAGRGGIGDPADRVHRGHRVGLGARTSHRLWLLRKWRRFGRKREPCVLN